MARSRYPYKFAPVTRAALLQRVVLDHHCGGAPTGRPTTHGGIAPRPVDSGAGGTGGDWRTTMYGLHATAHRNVDEVGRAAFAAVHPHIGAENVFEDRDRAEASLTVVHPERSRSRSGLNGGDPRVASEVIQRPRRHPSRRALLHDIHNAVERRQTQRQAHVTRPEQ